MRIGGGREEGGGVEAVKFGWGHNEGGVRMETGVEGGTMVGGRKRICEKQNDGMVVTVEGLRVCDVEKGMVCATKTRLGYNQK